MRKKSRASRSRAYFSIDAAFALVLAVFAYSSFALLASAAGASASAQSHEISSSLLSLRFSSFVLEQASAGTGGYWSANELDMQKLQGFGLASALSRSGRSYAKISVQGGDGEIFSEETGLAPGEVFCSGRLAILSGEIVRLEACLG